MKEPVDHIIRPQLPWRSGEDAITECGYDASKVKAITRADFFQRLKDYGSQRTSMLTCMTCVTTAQNHKTWEEDPRSAVDREIAWEGRWRRGENGHRLSDELFAIADLIEVHRAEFDAKVHEIAQRREWNEKKAARAEKPKAPRGPTVIL